MNTSDFVNHDRCARFRTWSSRYELPRIPLSEALHLGLRAGLIEGDQAAAYAKFMTLAANPGLDIEGRDIYDIAVHHAQMLEVLTAYLTTDGPWQPALPVSFAGGTFEPMSFQLPDGRLRRVVLCSTWNEMRGLEEKYSWWTMADVAATGRPMLVNVMVIGSSQGGYRRSPWTTGYLHPENGILRIRKKEGQFTDRWKKMYREQTDRTTLQWLSKMQQDEAFDGIVESFSVDPPDASVLKDMERIAAEIRQNGTEMRRSGCFQKVRCPMADLCHGSAYKTPSEALWREKPLNVIN